MNDKEQTRALRHAARDTFDLADPIERRDALVANPWYREVTASAVDRAANDGAPRQETEVRPEYEGSVDSAAAGDYAGTKIGPEDTQFGPDEQVFNGQAGSTPEAPQPQQ